MSIDHERERHLGFLIRRTDVEALGSVGLCVERYLRSRNEDPGAHSILFRATTPIDAIFVRVVRHQGTECANSGLEAASSLSMAQAFDLGAQIAMALWEPVWIRGEVPAKGRYIAESTAYRTEPTDAPSAGRAHSGASRSLEDYAAFVGLPTEYACRHFENNITPLLVDARAPLDVPIAASYLAHRAPFGPLEREPLAGFLVERVDESAPARLHQLLRNYLLASGEDPQGRVVRFSTAQGLPLLNVELPFHCDDLRRARLSERRHHLVSFVEVHSTLAALICTALECNVWAWESSGVIRPARRGPKTQSDATLDHRASLFSRENVGESEAREGLVTLARRLGIDLLGLSQLAQTEKVHLPLDAPFRGERVQAYLRAPPPPYIPPGPNEETVQHFELETWMVREAERIGTRLGCTYNQVFIVAWELGKRAIARRISRENGPVAFKYRSRLPGDLFVRRAKDVPAAPNDGETCSILLAVTWPLIDEGIALAQRTGRFTSLLATAYLAARPLLFGSFRTDPRAPWRHPILNPGMWRDYRIPPAAMDSREQLDNLT